MLARCAPRGYNRVRSHSHPHGRSRRCAMRRAAVLAVFLGLACGPGSRAADPKTDDDGFVRHWLILAPIPLADGQSGAEGLDKHQHKSDPVELKSGVNVIVFKVVNEKADFSGCLRLVDENEKPLAGMKVALKP